MFCKHAGLTHFSGVGRILRIFYINSLSSARRDGLFPPFPSGCFFYLGLALLNQTTWNKNSGSRYPFLDPNVREKVFIMLTLNEKVAVGLSFVYLYFVL